MSNQRIKHSGSCDYHQMFSVLKINESQSQPPFPPFFPQQVSFDNFFLDIQTPAVRLCSNFGLLDPQQYAQENIYKNSSKPPIS